jgi:6-phosphofructokinase
MFTNDKAHEQPTKEGAIANIVELDMDALCVVAGGDGTSYPFIGGK